MKLFYAPQSPFARKARVAAIELGLAERLQFEYAEVVPGRPNTAFAYGHNPLRKIPALVTDAGETIYVCIDDHWDKIHSSLGWFEQNDSELSEPVNIAHLALGSLLGYIDFRWPDHGWRQRFSQNK